MDSIPFGNATLWLPSERVPQAYVVWEGGEDLPRHPSREFQHVFLELEDAKRFADYTMADKNVKICRANVGGNISEPYLSDFKVVEKRSALGGVVFGVMRKKAHFQDHLIDNLFWTRPFDLYHSRTAAEAALVEMDEPAEYMVTTYAVNGGAYHDGWWDGYTDGANTLVEGILDDVATGEYPQTPKKWVEYLNKLLLEDGQARAEHEEWIAGGGK